MVKQQHAFTSEQIAELLNKKRVGTKAEARSYKLIHWRLTPEGGIVLSAEQQPSSSYNFRSNDILALQFSPDGEIDWFKHVYKVGEQPRKQKVFLSHYLFAKNNNTYLLYNQGLYSDGYAAAIKIDPSGKSTTRRFYTYERQQELFCPLLSFRLKSPQVFLCLQDRYFSSYRFALLDFETLFQEKNN